MDEREEKKVETEQEPRKKPFQRLKEWFLRKKDSFLRAVRERTDKVKHAKGKRIALFICTGLVLLLFLVFYLTVGKLIAKFIQDADSFKKWMDGFNPVVEVLVFLAFRILQTAFKLLPGGALEIAAGFVFGVWWGFLWSMLGSLLGSVLILFLGKKYGMKMVGLFVDPEKIHATNGADKKKRGVAFFLMYFLPWTPKDIFTWIASVTDDNPLFFILITTLARMPSVFISAWCGAAIVSQRYALAFTILGALILFGVLGSWIYKKAAKKHKEHVLARQAAENVSAPPNEKGEN